MKQVVTAIVLLAMSSTLFSQQNASARSFTKEDYLRKSKGQRTAGIILVSTGATACFIGTIAAVSDAVQNTSKEISRGVGNALDPGSEPAVKHQHSGGGIIFLGGAVASVVGIALLSEAGKNKKRALSVSFKPEKAFQLQNYNLVSRSVPALSLTISL